VLPRLEAWVTPPAYTGAPPIFLAASGGAGGTVTVRRAAGCRWRCREPRTLGARLFPARRRFARR
jgi:hypothetical protein